MLILLLQAATEFEWRHFLQAAAGFVGGGLAAALLLGQLYAWAERRIADLLAGA